MKYSPNAAYWIAVQAGVTPLGVGWPGSAKTQSAYSFARAMNRKLYTLIGSIRDPADFGIPFPVNPDVDHIVADTKCPLGNGKVAYFALAAPKWAADTWNGDKWIILCDELTDCPPAVRSGMLRFIAENVVGDLALPEDTWKCALCNPVAVATNGTELEPAMANRLCHIQWTMDWDAWDDGLSNGLKFPAPTFPRVPDDWRNQIPAVANMVRAFRSHRPDAFHPPLDAEGTVSCDRDRMSGPWPSPRSWTMAIQTRAAAIAAGCDRGILLSLLQGCVGHGALEYDEWENNLDLPDPKKSLDKAEAALKAGKEVPYVHPDRPDKVIAHLCAVVNQVVGDLNDTKRYNKSRWEAAVGIFHQASKYECDLAISCIRPLFRLGDGKAVRPQGAALDQEFQNLIWPIIEQVSRK